MPRRFARRHPKLRAAPVSKIRPESFAWREFPGILIVQPSGLPEKLQLRPLPGLRAEVKTAEIASDGGSHFFSHVLSGEVLPHWECYHLGFDDFFGDDSGFCRD